MPTRQSNSGGIALSHRFFAGIDVLIGVAIVGTGHGD